MSWTDEHVELLRKLWNEGLSASQVAAELGGGITRNAVIGKIHRLGLAERATAAARRVRAPPSSPRAQNSARGHGHVVGNVALAFAPRAHIAPAPTNSTKMWSSPCRSASPCWSCASRCADGRWAIRRRRSSASAEPRRRRVRSLLRLSRACRLSARSGPPPRARHNASGAFRLTRVQFRPRCSSKE